MWEIMVPIFTTCLLGSIILWLLWTESKPIFAYLYKETVKVLKRTGMTEQVAKAVVLVVVLIIIVIILLCSF